MPLALKRIAGKRQQPWLLTTTQRCPVDLDSRGPKLPERQQEGVAVVAVLGVVAHQPNGAVTA